MKYFPLLLLILGSSILAITQSVPLNIQVPIDGGATVIIMIGAWFGVQKYEDYQEKDTGKQ